MACIEEMQGQIEARRSAAIGRVDGDVRQPGVGPDPGPAPPDRADRLQPLRWRCVVSAEIDARRTAAAAVVADFEREVDGYTHRRADRKPDMATWAVPAAGSP